MTRFRLIHCEFDAQMFMKRRNEGAHAGDRFMVGDRRFTFRFDE